MFETSHEKTQEKTTDRVSSSPDFMDAILAKIDNPSKNNFLIEPNKELAETASAYLPNVLTAREEQENAGHKPAKKNSLAEMLMPDEAKQTSVGEKIAVQDPELKSVIDSKTQRALTKDADIFPPVHNPDGSITYTVVQAGITDRAGRDNSVDYYCRAIDVTVPANSKASLDDCQYFLHPRKTISKDHFDKLIERDKATHKDVDFYAHGISTSDSSSDKQAFMLGLSSGLPTVNLDWAASPTPGNNPLNSLDGYENDTISAKRANDNTQFQTAIDDTVKAVGAEHSDMIGFSHGGFFDARYLAHRVENGLPQLNKVILTHPDVPISAPELQVHGKPELLKDAAKESYVVGGTWDLAMKVAVLASYLLPHSPVFEHWHTEERLGNDSGTTRGFIKSEGATAITERDRDGFFNTEHFLNYAGMSQLLNSAKNPPNKLQASFDSGTDISRTNPHAAA